MEEHTFVIPAYKSSVHLEECLRSLLNQSVKSKIVITTSTPDLFVEKLALKYQIDYIINADGPKGIAADWNFALSQVQTKWATIAHQDDIYQPTFAEDTIRQTSAVKCEVLIAFTGYEDLVNGQVRKSGLNTLVKSTMLAPFFFTKWINRNYLKKIILRFGDPICCPSVTLNLIALHDFSFPTDYHCALDWYAWYKLAQQPGAFVFIDKKLVKHRVHRGSETTNQINNGIRKQEELRLFEIMWNKGFARFIAKIYALGYKDNIV